MRSLSASHRSLQGASSPVRPFRYVRATDPVAAVHAGTAHGAKYLGGGTNLLDLMKEDIERPTTIVDITRLNLSGVDRFDVSSTLALGALASNSVVANHPLVRKHYPLLTQAILAGASGQIRNMATMGGNVNQRTRCAYFYEPALPCNKRKLNSGCSAIEGINRGHAVFGWSPACVATHPERHVRCARRARCSGASSGQRSARTGNPVRRVPSAPGRSAGSRQHAETRRVDHVDRATRKSSRPRIRLI